MSLPTAVTSSTKTPGFYISINLLAGAANAGTSALRALGIGQKNTSDGNITPDAEVRKVFGPDDVKASHGEGSLLHLAAIQMFLAFGLLALDVVAPAAGGSAVAAVWEYTISGAPTVNMTFDFDVKGAHTGAVPWAVGESITVFRTRAIAALNAVRPLPVIASAGGTGKLDLTAKSGGPWGSDIVCGVTLLTGAGGAVSAPINTVAGAVEFSIANVLALVLVTEYAAIGLATSNADAATASNSTSNAGLLSLQIAARKSGKSALLQYGFVGYTGSIANVETGAVGRNAVDFTYAYLQNGQSTPAEVMGWDLGDAMNWYSQRANYNRIGNRAPYLIGSKNPQADSLTDTETEDLLNHGISPYDFVANSTTELGLVDAITTHSLDASGNADARCFYQSDVWGANFIVRDLRVSLPQEFPNCSITEDLPPGDDQLPAGVVERKDVQSFTQSRVRGGVRQGVVDGNYLEARIADGSFAVEIDEDDASQVDIFLPFRIVKPLAKFSLVANKTG